MTAGCVTDMGGGDPSGGGDGKADGTSASGSLAGKYAMELTSHMKLEDTRESNPSKRYSSYDLRARAVVTVSQDGDDVSLSVKLCDVTLPEVSGYQPELDAAFVAGLDPVTLSGKVAHNGGDTLEIEEGALVLGAALAHPTTDALPTDGNSSRVRDQDRDGHPGVSVKIPGYGSIFSALRVRVGFSAPVDDAEDISGDADLTLDEAIYGDSIWFYDAASSFAESQQYVNVVTATNRFELVRHVGTCSGVRSTFP